MENSLMSYLGAKLKMTACIKLEDKLLQCLLFFFCIFCFLIPFTFDDD